MKRKITVSICVAISVIAFAVVWKKWFSSTEIAFLNYQVIELGEISRSNENAHIKISVIDDGQIDELEKYDMLFINAMGLRITEEQRNRIQESAAAGLPVMTTAATNPANNIVSVDSLQAMALKAYLNGGGRRNYRNMLEYVRCDIDGKKAWIADADVPEARRIYQFSHPDPESPDNEDLGFNSVAEYNGFLRRHSLWKESAPQVVITGQMGEPSGLVLELERTGNIVYRVNDMRQFIVSGQADSVNVSAVINMAHGRMGDYIVDYLKECNIPLFAPLNVNRPVEDWEADKMGMNGGFLSQSVVTPEIDGAIRPFALFGHYKDKEGLLHTLAIPDRLEMFVETVNRHMALKHTPNSEKRVAIVYYKGPGQNALTASGMEVVNSLYNLLVRMKQEGYGIDNMPSSAEALGALLQSRGTFFGTYAKGSMEEFMQSGNPELITAGQYEAWTGKSLRKTSCDELVKVNGEFPGSYMATPNGELALPRVELGNVVLMPQMPAADGDNSFQIVHGAEVAPTHNYVASYLWLRYGFKADILLHFGTHGSLEFTPRKQVALSDNDWPDRLVGALPHLYVYSIGDVGEGMIAKRRSYATLQSHLTPPFIESEVRGIYKELTDAIRDYNGNPTYSAAEAVSRLTVKLGIHRELGLDSLAAFTAEEILRVENFAEELANEKITGELYTMGNSYSEERIKSSVYAMSVEPIAYSLLALDKLKGKASADSEKHKAMFTRRYVEPARRLTGRLYSNDIPVSDKTVCEVAGITREELVKSREIIRSISAPQDIMSQMRAMAANARTMHGLSSAGQTDNKMEKALAMAKKMGASPEELKKMETAMRKKERGQAGTPQSMDMSAMMGMMAGGKSYSKKEIETARAVMEIERTVRNVAKYRKALLDSPEAELASLMNAMNGGYTAPSSGGDPIANPDALPTGRNLYAINAEAAPTETAWEKGVQLARQTIEMYMSRHDGSIPRKVSYTLWSGEFIESEGATVAQVLYMLGVEPVRDVFGRVTDLRLIPSAELGRPRIDVVVQTSGQLRDIAASRLFLISRAVEMAAAAKDTEYENQVAANAVRAEQLLIEKGLSPKEAREISTYRVFGGVNGGYGTGIQGMVQNGGTWEDASEIAAIYLNNMGAFYGSEKNWEQMTQYAFEAALDNTDAVIQPRQSNTWGALSLDHVYEFMGGMNLAVKNVTGKEPDAYLSDYRNRNNARMQEVKEAVGVESRTTIFNPTYIKAKMNSGTSAAGEFAEIVRNAYGWNVMKPEVIGNEMWDEIYNVYIQDKYNLGIRGYFERQNPAALENIATTMLETARKGMWKASDGQLSALAELHAELLGKYKLSGSAVFSNNKLRDFIADKTDASAAAGYNETVRRITEASVSENGIVMKKESVQRQNDNRTAIVSNTVVILIVLAVALLLVRLVYVRRKKLEE